MLHAGLPQTLARPITGHVEPIDVIHTVLLTQTTTTTTGHVESIKVIHTVLLTQQQQQQQLDMLNP